MKMIKISKPDFPNMMNELAQFLIIEESTRNKRVELKFSRFVLPGTLKEIFSQTDLYLVSLSSKHVFEDKMTK